MKPGARLIEAGREVSYNQPGTRHDVLLAAPADAFDRLSPALRAALAPPGRRA